MISILLYTLLSLVLCQGTQQSLSSPLEIIIDGDGGFFIVSRSVCQTEPGITSLGLVINRYASNQESEPTWTVFISLFNVFRTVIVRAPLRLLPTHPPITTNTSEYSTLVIM
jgi:hypothetical protein